jgi:hypothetical protein
MKTAFLALSVTFASICFGQDVTKNDVYTEFNLSQRDHRGFQFIATNNDCEESFKSIKHAIEFAFTTSKRKDMMFVCVDLPNSKFLNQIYSVEDLVELYMSLKD